MVSIPSTRSYHAVRKQEQPESADPDTRRTIRIISIIILLLSLCLLAWCKINDPQTMPIRNVKINGNYAHVDKGAVQKMVLPFIKEGFVNIEVDSLKKALQGLPWVDNASVTRRWPDNLVINIIEHTPVAFWNEQGLLDTNGVIFTPDTRSGNDLPILNGPEGQQQLMWKNYQKLNAQLTPQGLRIMQLYLSPRQAWTIQLSNGIRLILGKNNPEIRLQRLAAIYPQMIESHDTDIDYIDLRYTGGVAVKWKENQ